MHRIDVRILDRACATRPHYATPGSPDSTCAPIEAPVKIHPATRC